MIAGVPDASRFSDFSGDYLLVSYRASIAMSDEWSPVEPHQATRIVARVVTEDPSTRMRLRTYLAHTPPRIRARGQSVVEPVRQLAERLVRGLAWGPEYLLFVRARPPVATGMIEPPWAMEPPSPPEPVFETQWLRVILRDDRGEPVADVGFEVEFDDGSVHTSRTNAAGEGYLFGLNPGRAKIRWPDLHPDDWALV